MFGVRPRRIDVESIEHPEPQGRFAEPEAAGDVESTPVPQIDLKDRRDQVVAKAIEVVDELAGVEMLRPDRELGARAEGRPLDDVGATACPAAAAGTALVDRRAVDAPARSTAPD